MTHRTLHPPSWARTRGYSSGIRARGELVFVAGQIGWTPDQQLVSRDFLSQARQALENVVAVLAEAGARPEHVVRLTWYVTDRNEYMAAAAPLGEAYRAVMGRHFPAMTAVEVTALMEPGAVVEIEATAVIPD